jgi:hypothetical protein
MPKLIRARIHTGTGIIYFVPGNDNTDNINKNGSANITWSFSVSSPNSDFKIWDSVKQTDNNITLHLKNITAGNNISISDNNDILTISANSSGGSTPTAPIINYTGTWETNYTLMVINQEGIWSPNDGYISYSGAWIGSFNYSEGNIGD